MLYSYLVHSAMRGSATWLSLVQYKAKQFCSVMHELAMRCLVQWMKVCLTRGFKHTSIELTCIANLCGRCVYWYYVEISVISKLVQSYLYMCIYTYKYGCVWYSIDVVMKYNTDFNCLYTRCKTVCLGKHFFLKHSFK